MTDRSRRPPRVLYVRVDESLLAALDDLARRKAQLEQRDVPRSEIVREALRAYTEAAA